MQRFSERLVLICEECGERMILLGSEADWRARQPVFKCECGEKLTLDGRASEEVLATT